MNPQTFNLHSVKKPFHSPLTKYGETGLDLRDSVILATMKTTDTEKIATHDQAFKEIPDITVIDSIP
ncbi:MAG: type II toxin-antitoxin system VapC family toxin [Thermoproteota archaeon]